MKVATVLIILAIAACRHTSTAHLQSDGDFTPTKDGSSESNLASVFSAEHMACYSPQDPAQAADDTKTRDTETKSAGLALSDSDHCVADFVTYYNDLALKCPYEWRKCQDCLNAKRIPGVLSYICPQEMKDVADCGEKAGLKLPQLPPPDPTPKGYSIDCVGTASKTIDYGSISHGVKDILHSTLAEGQKSLERNYCESVIKTAKRDLEHCQHRYVCRNGSKPSSWGIPNPPPGRESCTTEFDGVNASAIPTSQGTTDLTTAPVTFKVEIKVDGYCRD